MKQRGLRQQQQQQQQHAGGLADPFQHQQAQHQPRASFQPPSHVGYPKPPVTAPGGSSFAQPYTDPSSSYAPQPPSFSSSSSSYAQQQSIPQQQQQQLYGGGGGYNNNEFQQSPFLPQPMNMFSQQQPPFNNNNNMAFAQTFAAATANPLVYAAVTDAASQMASQQVRDASVQALTIWGNLKIYFTVDNSYCIKKIGLLFFPYLKKDWSRMGETTAPPKIDRNAPDLYIPLMALTTYVLMVGLVRGNAMKFNPEDLVGAFGSSFTAQLLQVLIMRMSLWVVGQNRLINWLDLLAFSGYQYVGVAFNMMIGVLFGGTFYNVALGYTALSTGFVTYKSISSVIPPPEVGHGGYKRRQYFLWVCVVLQFFVMWFLGFSRDYRPTSLFDFASSSSSSSLNKFSFPSNGDKEVPILQKQGNDRMRDAIVKNEKDSTLQKEALDTGNSNKREETVKVAGNKKRVIVEDDEEEEEEIVQIRKSKPKRVTQQQQQQQGKKKKTEDV